MSVSSMLPGTGPLVEARVQVPVVTLEQLGMQPGDVLMDGSSARHRPVRNREAPLTARP
jgi:hypothetical protein